MPQSTPPSHRRPKPAPTPAASRPAAPPTLPDQKLDFTAEGAPAPGQVPPPAPARGDVPKAGAGRPSQGKKRRR